MPNTNFFLDRLDTFLPILGMFGAALGWLIKQLIKKAKALIAKIHSAHARISEMDDEVKELRSELSHYSSTIQTTINEKINFIQSTMTAANSKLQDSIEKILVLMIKRKDSDH